MTPDQIIAAVVAKCGPVTEWNLAEPGELVAAWRAVLSDASVTLIPADYRATTAARLLAAAWADLQSMHVAAEDAVRGADALIAELAERGVL